MSAAGLPLPAGLLATTACRLTHHGMVTVRPLAADDIPALTLMVNRAFTGPDGWVPPQYGVVAVAERLMWSLASSGHGGPVTLVADLGGEPVALGQYARCRWAAATWSMMLGATSPHLQGSGIGHALVLARFDAIRREGGGMVLVSALRPERWIRYGFAPLSVNPVTGCAMMGMEMGGAP